MIIKIISLMINVLDHYQVLCGLSRTELSHGCGVITYGLVRIGRGEAGAEESMSLSLPVEGVQVRLYAYIITHHDIT